MGLSDVFLKRPEILDDEKKLKGAFADYYTGDALKINIMMKAYEEGIIEALSETQEIDFAKKKVIDRLVTQHGIQDSIAQNAIKEWCGHCTKDVIKKYHQYLEAQKKAEEAKVQDDISGLPSEDEETPLTELNVNYDDYRRYYNLSLSDNPVVYGIPCGVGNSDYGFIVKGTGREDLNDRSLFPSVHALVYNFLIRNTHITKECYPQYIKNHSFTYEIDYGHVFRYMMILIDLLKQEGETELHLNLLGDKDEFDAAVDILNEYLGVFSRLTKSNPSSIRVVIDDNGKSISVDQKADYYVENYKKDQGLRRRIRYGRRINYSLTNDDREDLEFLLREMSDFKSFKKGQFTALCSMMNANEHAVCIMPTGSGKSLIYYIAAMLQPQVAFVVSPTDILIKDQIRNLRKFHYFDSVTHLELSGKTDFSFFKPATSLLFLTPSTFQNRNLFGVFKQRTSEISYVVLDEIHCLSSWGHDFRPEYLMLSRNMLKYRDKARYMGFTATADYSVVQDIPKQLGIEDKNFYSPILFEKNNINYDFRAVDDTEEMYKQLKTITDEIIRRDERALVFVKSDEIAKEVAHTIGYEADVFSADRPESYSQFVSGLCRILVASSELGIGVNLPNVNCTVHFGIPLSKNEFVQEIGRAGRADEKVTSYVLYLKPSEENIPNQLLQRKTVVNNLPQLLEMMKNDYSDAYHLLNCGMDTSEVLFEKLIDVYSNFHVGKKTYYFEQKPIKGIEHYKKLLYMLFVTGYVKDWSTQRKVNKDKIEIGVDICSVQNAGGHGVVAISDSKMLERMKKASVDYYASMGNDRESIFKVNDAEKLEDVIKVYVDWYYDKFLYHHKEQFIDFFEFLISNKDGDALRITDEIEEYFQLPFIEIKEDEEYYSNMSIAEISDEVIKGIGKNTLINIERLNSDNYLYKLDYLLFIGRWSRDGSFNATRVERFWEKLSDDEREVFYKTMAVLYGKRTDEQKLTYLNYVDDKNSIVNCEMGKLTDLIYEVNPRDKVYYGMVALNANRKFALN